MVIDYQKNIVTISGQSSEVGTVAAQANLFRMEDLPSEKTVRLYFEEKSDAYVAWAGDGYDAIGQWTDVQASGRAVGILQSLPPEIRIVG